MIFFGRRIGGMRRQPDLKGHFWPKIVVVRHFSWRGVGALYVQGEHVMPKSTLLKRAVSVMSAATLALVGVAIGVTPAQAAPAVIQPQPTNSITADRLPTVQINGVVWSTDVAGSKVYAGGSFTRARPAGSALGVNETVRNNLLAFDVNTGNLDTTFAPDLNGQVLGVAVFARQDPRLCGR